MKFIKIRDVKTPSRGTPQSSGIDLFVPNYSEEFYRDLREKNKYIQIDSNGILLHSLKRVLIPSGIKVAVPIGYDLCVHNKSGIACKKGLIYGAHVVDVDYNGELFLSIINASDESQMITWGEKIVQVILRQVNLEDVEECTVEEFNDYWSNFNSQRGSGALGSTGTK